MTRPFLAATLGLLLLGLAAAWNGRQMRELADNRTRDNMLDQELRVQMVRSSLAATKISWIQMAEIASPWIVAPPGPLQSLAAGQDSVRATARPSLLETLGWRVQESMDNPNTNLFGTFDLSIVLLYLFPLYVLFTGTVSPMFRSVILGLAMALSVAGVALSGAPWASVDTWLRVVAWLGATFLYVRFWIVLREAINGRALQTWLAGSAYILALIIAPGFVSLLLAVVLPPGSAARSANELYAAEVAPAAERSRALARIYEAHPDLTRNPPQADASSAAAIAAARETLIRAESTASGAVGLHQALGGLLRILTPAAAAQGAFLESSGTGDSRYGTVLAQGNEFAGRWASHFLSGAKSGQAPAPADLGKMPRFEFQEQSALGWLPGFVICVLALVGWTFLIPRLLARFA